MRRLFCHDGENGWTGPAWRGTGETPDGTGVRAGGAVRAVVEVAGIQNIVSKVLGTRSKISNVAATIEGLKKLRKNK